MAAEASSDLAKAEQAHMGASNFAEGGDEAAEAKEALGNLYERGGRYKDALDAFSDSNEMAFDDYYPEENMAYGQKTRTC